MRGRQACGNTACGGDLVAQRAVRSVVFVILLPNDGSVLHNRGAVNMQLGQYSAAVEAYEGSLSVSAKR
jgi:regulator of sirC expression with transglutaminase-like and TPR domain